MYILIPISIDRYIPSNFLLEPNAPIMDQPADCKFVCNGKAFLCGGVGVGVGRAPVSKIHAGERITQKRAGVGGGPRTPPSAFFSPNQVFKVGFLIFFPGIVPLCRMIWS